MKTCLILNLVCSLCGKILDIFSQEKTPEGREALIEQFIHGCEWDHIWNVNTCSSTLKHSHALSSLHRTLGMKCIAMDFRQNFDKLCAAIDNLRFNDKILVAGLLNWLLYPLQYGSAGWQDSECLERTLPTLTLSTSL